MEELESDFVGDLRTLINDERFYEKERFYKIIASLKVMPELLELAKKKD
jgi:hypothetical protein